MSQPFLSQKMRAVTLNIGPILFRKSYLWFFIVDKYEFKKKKGSIVWQFYKIHKNVWLANISFFKKTNIKSEFLITNMLMEFFSVKLWNSI